MIFIVALVSVVLLIYDGWTDRKINEFADISEEQCEKVIQFQEDIKATAFIDDACYHEDVALPNGETLYNKILRGDYEKMELEYELSKEFKR